ncbi:ImmA/IrrE family metallo-endopeptidase [Arthrobacter agilis]|uniref:ImmA/IrrE family metallo-endopeptidase n=1 Tax=Arthrobacter agilis TaxID=37921 RepID=UPI002366E4E5|nr:ImmA/IrrE family metallo-endopeptidase [Arthrobacter agilis]WDF32213.1 ImmA/IrrE family metallo-endopeptidase [Arthrobacter agilis]
MVSTHPWRELRAMPHITVEWVELPEGVDARTNGVDRILMDKWLLQVERRCALAHELQHIRMGHRGHQCPRVELVVRVIVARRLISLEDLIAARQWSGNDLWEMAEELWVTPEVLWDRLNHLDGKERDALHALD